MYAIDAPELAQPSDPESAENLASIVRRVETLMVITTYADHYGSIMELRPVEIRVCRPKCHHFSAPREPNESKFAFRINETI